MTANSSTTNLTETTMNDATVTSHGVVVSSDERQPAPLVFGNNNNGSSKNKNKNYKKMMKHGLFPYSLHHLLEEAHAHNQTHIVSWVAQGTAFKVHDKDAFVKEIMPKYFRSSTYKSFQRSLNIWGFGSVNHVRTGITKGSVYHEHFCRGKVNLCQLMKREKVKGEAARLKRTLDGPSPPFRRPPFVPLNDDGTKFASSCSSPLRTPTRPSPLFVSNNNHHEENQQLTHAILKTLLIQNSSTVHQDVDALAATLLLRSGTDGYRGAFFSQPPPPPPPTDIATLALALLLSASNN